jgi:ubiquinone/menaquinone biosynthesis C-methylase UbiE
MTPFAADLAPRVSGPAILELAAGTGVLTRMLCDQLGDEAHVTATDLNEPMLAILRRRTTGKNVSIQHADACDLPFEDEKFDSVVSQFGVMFFPNKPCALGHAYRVLKPGGRFIFNVWDSLEHNDFARVTNAVLKELFVENPPKFYETPFGFHDTAVMTEWLHGAGFVDVKFERVAKECTGECLADFCTGLIDGNPVAMELESLGGTSTDDARYELQSRFANSFGDKPFSMKMQAIVFEATKR